MHDVIWMRRYLSIISGTARALLQKDHGAFVATNAFVQLLPLLSAPIVMRLYAPEIFGTFAIFSAVATILGVIATLSIQNAILIEQDDTDAMRAAVVALLVAMIASLVGLLSIISLPSSLMRLLLGEEVISFLPWTTLVMALSGTFATLYTWHIRVNAYRHLGRSRLAQGLLTVSIQIFCGLSYPEASTLIIANIAGFCIAIAMLSAPFVVDINRTGALMRSWNMWGTIKLHQALPKYTMPASLLNAIGSQLPDLLINRYFGASTVGHYALANRVVNQPLSFLAVSMQDIFRQKSSEEFRRTGKCVKSFNQFFVFLFAVAVVVVAPIAIVAPWVFAFMFGKEWQEAGALVQCLSILIAVRFISSPLSYVWILRGKQHLDMLWQIGLLILTAIAFQLADWIWPGASLAFSLILYSGLVGFWYGLCILLSSRFSR